MRFTQTLFSRLASWAALALVLCSCAGRTPKAVVEATPVNRALYEKVARLVPDISSMSLEQKVAQLFIVAPEKLSPGARTSVTEEMRAAFGNIPVGGFCLFAANIVDPAQIVEYTSGLHQLGCYPLIAVDEEGGKVSRFAVNPAFDVPHYESMYAVGRSDNPLEAFNVGICIGSYLRQYGFDVDFAPIADVFTNPVNTVIGRRAFSSDPQKAAEMMTRCMQGLRLSGVEACLKHFPGHGDTATDSHLGCAETSKTWEQMLSCEIIPFKKGIANDAHMVMVGHISCPAVTGDSVPASLSPLMMEKLRNELGFKGLIITDSLGMGAVSGNHSPAEAAVLALKAGADILLMPRDLKAAYSAVLDAVRDGSVPEARVDRSVEKILQFKRDLLISRGE